MDTFQPLLEIPFDHRRRAQDIKKNGMSALEKHLDHCWTWFSSFFHIKSSEESAIMRFCKHDFKAQKKQNEVCNSMPALTQVLGG